MKPKQCPLITPQVRPPHNPHRVPHQKRKPRNQADEKEWIRERTDSFR